MLLNCVAIGHIAYTSNTMHATPEFPSLQQAGVAAITMSLSKRLHHLILLLVLPESVTESAAAVTLSIHLLLIQVAFMTQAGLEYDQCTAEELNARVQPSGKALWELLAQVEESKWNQKMAAELKSNAASRSFFKAQAHFCQCKHNLHSSIETASCKLQGCVALATEHAMLLLAVNCIPKVTALYVGASCVNGNRHPANHLASQSDAERMGLLS